MSRRDRRAALARGKVAATSARADLSALAAEATLAYQQGRLVDAEVACKQVLARDPAHAEALNILGVVYQASGNHRFAAKTLAKAIAVNTLSAASHYNIATSYQALLDHAAAARHFKTAIALGLDGKGVENFLLQDPRIVDYASRMIERHDDLPLKNDNLLDAREIATIAGNIFLRCALETTVIRGVTLELFLTGLRRALLRIAADRVADSGEFDPDTLRLLCSLAQQCFLNEYVFAEAADETRRAHGLCELLLRRVSTEGDVPTVLLAIVAAYFPLHALPEANSLLVARWRPEAADLLRVQVREPLEEADDRPAIAVLTAVEDRTSLEVMRQYEDNPYPRWTVNPFAALSRAAMAKSGTAVGDQSDGAIDILIAGCGTGEHAVDVGQRFPKARVLAIDLSLASLAYARRKTREEGLRNIEYAQADILKLSTLGRRFDRVEALGVLHHLADPRAGWRVLLSLLAVGGIMRVGLYSEAGRRAIVEARALIAERGFPATAQGIRSLRQTIIRERSEPRWQSLVRTVDFYSTSGCHDMFFNVMEHRLTLPQIKALLDERKLSFLGFELDPKVIDEFRAEHPDAGALRDLDAWDAFEAGHPQTFRNMYIFSIADDRPAATAERSAAPAS